jgi:hypothetical protein
MVVAAVFCFVAVDPAYASSWVPLPRPATTGWGHIDMDSVRREGQYANAWLKIPPNTKVANEAYAEIEVKMDCTGRRWAVMTTLGYSAAGESLEDWHEQGYPDWESVAPDSIAEDVYKLVC